MHRRTLLILLLQALASHTQHVTAGTAADTSAGSLIFSIAPHPGQGGWLIAKLNVTGAFILYGPPQTVRGKLPVQECRRIFEEFEKLCAAAGVEHAALPARPGRRNTAPFFRYESPQGQILELTGPDSPLPPALVDFMRTLWHKLSYQISKNPVPEPASAPTANPPLPVSPAFQVPPALR